MSIFSRSVAVFLAVIFWQANAHADFESVKKAAEAGNAEKQLELGTLYEYDPKLKGKNQVLALTWYMLSADQGVAMAAKLRDGLQAKLTAAQVQEARAEVDRLKQTMVFKPVALKPEPKPTVAPAAAAPMVPKTNAAPVAESQAPKTEPAATTPAFSGNLGIFSNYVFRGVTQTSEKPAFQLGLDYAHSSGIYVGVWGSNVSWLNDSGIYTGSTIELDGYLGYKGSFGKSDFGYEVGGIFYSYDGRMISYINSAKTHEVYAGLSWKWVSVKYSYALTDYFSTPDSEGTTYTDVSLSYPVGKTGVTLLGHVGHLKLTGNNGLNDPLYGYTDWKLGATYALPQGFIVGAYYADTNALASSYTYHGRNWADNQYVVYIQKTF